MRACSLGTQVFRFFRKVARTSAVPISSNTSIFRHLFFLAPFAFWGAFSIELTQSVSLPNAVRSSSEMPSFCASSSATISPPSKASSSLVCASLHSAGAPISPVTSNSTSSGSGTTATRTIGIPCLNGWSRWRQSRVDCAIGSHASSALWSSADSTTLVSATHLAIPSTAQQ